MWSFSLTAPPRDTDCYHQSVKTSHRFLIAFLTLLVVFLIVRAATKDRGVLLRNRIFAERLLDGTDPYEGGLHTPYPLTWALFHSSLLFLPVTLERIVWCAGQIALLAALILALTRATRAQAPRSKRREMWIVALALILTSRFWIRDMAGGGSNLLIAGLTMFGCIIAYRTCRHRRLLGGALVGLACALKLTPLLFLPFFVLARRTGLALVSAAFAAAFLAAPALVIGIDRYVEISGRWLGGVVGFLGQNDLTGDAGAIIPFEWMNQSLRNAVFRFTTSLEPPHPAYRDLLQLSATTATWIYRGLALALLGASAWILRPGDRNADAAESVRRDDPVGWFGRCAWVFLLMLLLSPISWRAHFVSTLPAIFLISLHAFAGNRGRGLSITVLVLFALLAPGTNETFWGKDGKMLLQAHYTVTLATLVLLPALAWIIRHPQAFDPAWSGSGTAPASGDRSSRAMPPAPAATAAEPPSSSESP